MSLHTATVGDRTALVYTTAKDHIVLAWFDEPADARSEQDRLRRLPTAEILEYRDGKQLRL